MNSLRERAGAVVFTVAALTGAACTPDYTPSTNNAGGAINTLRPTTTSAATSRPEIAINENGAAQDAARRLYDAVLGGNEQQILALLTANTRDGYVSSKDNREDFWQPRFNGIRSGAMACGAKVIDTIPVKDTVVAGTPTKVTGVIWDRVCDIKIDKLVGTFKINAVMISLQKEGAAWKATTFEPIQVQR